MKKHIVTVLIQVLFVSLFLTPSQRVVAQQAPAANSITVAGLRDRVTVKRDERGIPYIEAKNDADLYFVQGYIVASDRLWQMDLLRRNERGELAEVLGNAVLEQDKQHRTLGFAQEVELEIAKASPGARAVLDGAARRNGVLDWALAQGRREE